MGIEKRLGMLIMVKVENPYYYKKVSITTSDDIQNSTKRLRETDAVTLKTGLYPSPRVADKYPANLLSEYP